MAGTTRSATASGVLDQGDMNFEVGVDAQRRESPAQGETSNGVMGRATLGW